MEAQLDIQYACKWDEWNNGGKKWASSYYKCCGSPPPHNCAKLPNAYNNLRIFEGGGGGGEHISECIQTSNLSVYPNLGVRPIISVVDPPPPPTPS